jgi:S1-C subfamily serine protease
VKTNDPTKRLLVGLLLASVSFAATLSLAITEPAQSKVVQVEVVIALVGKDLQVRPVPKYRIQFQNVTAPDLVYEGTTSFEGKLSLPIPPGDYVIRSTVPLEFENVKYSWNLPVHLGETPLRIELANDNAERKESAQRARSSTDEGELFQKVKSAVFTVMAEGTKGSGFFVDRDGLILTNHHVVAESDFIAVKTNDKCKYKAILLSDDPRHDVAVLLINPRTIEGVSPIPLAESSPDRSPVAVGDRVIAIGSPISTEGILTTGIVSKVEDGAIISDVNINPGNSGGPLLNMDGEVVGINTFGMQADAGPGISGIVRIHVAQSVLATAKERAKTVVLPGPEKLPVPPPDPYPPDALQGMVNADLDPAQYHLEAGKMDVQVFTPVVIASLERKAAIKAAMQKSKRVRTGKQDTAGTQAGASSGQQAAEGFYEWRRYAGDYQPIVRVEAIPEITMTVGSSFAKAMLGATAPGRFRFKTDFLKMRLLRDGIEVQPVHPGKIRQVVSTRSGVDVMEDIETFGSYEYSPEAFEPSKSLVLEVYSEDKPDKPKILTFEKTLQMRIWQDFAPYFSSLDTKKGAPKQ